MKLSALFLFNFRFNCSAAIPLALTLMGLAGCSQPPAPVVTETSASKNTNHPGQALYQQHCASCHSDPEQTKAPGYESLSQMRYQMIHYALTRGKMQLQGQALTANQKNNLIEYLVGKKAADYSWIPDMMCSSPRRTPDLSRQATVTTFGFNKRNHRHLTKEETGLTTADMTNLELAWAIGFPSSTAMRAQPAVVGKTLFLPVAHASRLFAINIDGSPCFQWVYENDIPLRTSAAHGRLADGRQVLAFADLGSNVHLVDAQTGEKIWKRNVALYQHSLTTGTPVIHKEKILVPISQYEIALGADENHVCCKTHGAVTALDANTGETIWTAHTMEEAQPIRDRGDGQMIWGPSGAPIWNSPSIDEKRGLLYVGTGEATSEPAHPNTDAILAIDLVDGTIRWSFQATANDIFLSGCSREPGLNCPQIPRQQSRDVDFGASTILAQREDGSELVLAGQKSGALWALNPDNGEVVWRQEFGEGSPLGGIHWGIAFDGEQVYAPINRPYRRRDKTGEQKPGLHAVNVNTGEVTWSFAAQPDCSGDRQSRVPRCDSLIGLSGAPMVVDGTVIAGSLDGKLRIFDTRTGELLFDFDAARSFDTLNGVEAKGGSFDAAQMVAANGQLIVSSGYGRFGQVPGNVLLGFKPASDSRLADELPADQ